MAEFYGRGKNYLSMFLKHFDSISTEMKEINLSRLHYIGLATICVNVFVMTYSLYFLLVENTDQIIRYQALTIIHFCLLLIMIIALITISILKKRTKCCKSFSFIQNIMSFSIIISGACISVFAQLNHSSIMAFLIACLSVSILFVLRPIWAIFFFLIGYFILFYFMDYTQVNETILRANRTNGMTIVALCTCLSMFLWKVNKVNIEQKRLIQRQQDELEKKNKELQMAFLQSQIKPHFLYNALNTIMYFCVEDNSRRAADLLESLCKYLQNSFDLEGMGEKVFIERELDLTKAYLHIEKARFGDRLKIIWEIDDNINEEKILPLTIQPLVENAVKHGLMKKKEGGYVKIGIKKQKKGIKIHIEDNGIGMLLNEMNQNKKLPHKTRASVGLENIQERLNQYYGTKLTIDSIPGKGTKVSFMIHEAIITE